MNLRLSPRPIQAPAPLKTLLYLTHTDALVDALDSAVSAGRLEAEVLFLS